MDTYDHVLSPDFQPHEEASLLNTIADVEVDENELEGDYLPESQEDAPALPSRGKAVTKGMSEGERKSRQKQQNRKAAERSRAKRRLEHSAMEISVHNTRLENEQLRKRLVTLLASRPNEASSSTILDPNLDPSLATIKSATSSSTTKGIGIDYTYLTKLQTELSTAKSILLDKELELARLNGIPSNSELDGLRKQLSSQASTLTTMEAESSSLEATIQSLQVERDEIAKQGKLVKRELEVRKVARDTDGEEDVEELEIRGVEVDPALLDVSGWMEAAAKSWEEEKSVQVDLG